MGSARGRVSVGDRGSAVVGGLYALGIQGTLGGVVEIQRRWIFVPRSPSPLDTATAVARGRLRASGNGL